MNVIYICGISLIAVVLSSILKGLKKEFAVFLSIIFGIILLKYSISIFANEFSFLNELVNSTPLGKYSNTLLKIFGISLIVETISDICKDSGESSIASKIELLGKIEILLISIPLIERILQIIQEIML